jgi:hypothetical protein
MMARRAHHLTEQLRRMLRAETRSLSVRASALLVGLSPATLHRFLAGAAPGQRTIDVLYARYRAALYRDGLVGIGAMLGKVKP